MDDSLKTLMGIIGVQIAIWFGRHLFWFWDDRDLFASFFVANLFIVVVILPVIALIIKLVKGENEEVGALVGWIALMVAIMLAIKFVPRIHLHLEMPSITLAGVLFWGAVLVSLAIAAAIVVAIIKQIIAWQTEDVEPYQIILPVITLAILVGSYFILHGKGARGLELAVLILPTAGLAIGYCMWGFLVLIVLWALGMFLAHGSQAIGIFCGLAVSACVIGFVVSLILGSPEGGLFLLGIPMVMLLGALINAFLGYYSAPQDDNIWPKL